MDEFLKHYEVLLIKAKVDLKAAKNLYSDFKNGEEDLDLETLKVAITDDSKLQKIVKNFAAPRYKEGYEKGVHDHDAALILKQLIITADRADLLRFDPLARGVAQIYWANTYASDSLVSTNITRHKTWHDRAQSAEQMKQATEQGKERDMGIY